MLQLPMFATLKPTKAERGQPHIATLVSFNDRPVPVLDYLARDSIAPQFHAERLDTPEESTFEDETTDEAHEGSGTSGEEDESEADDSGMAEGTIHLLCPTNCNERIEPHNRRYSGYVAGSKNSHGNAAPHREVRNHAILIRRIKKIEGHHIHRRPRIRLYNTARATDVDPEPRRPDYVGHHPLPDGPDKDIGIDRQEEDGMCIIKEHMEPCPDEQDLPLPTGIESLQGTWHTFIYARTITSCRCPLESKKCKPKGAFPGDRDEEQDMLPTEIEHLQADSEPCPDNDPGSVPVGIDEVHGIPSFIEN
ncbi:Hypothetical predicted protein [Olea europaea subsp. europaea]|uniref:Uncharacterized protein n=1 Tax=Olea europaea subsp. europaea TaxID=158383 RepID=A0A8S0PRX7_OLEEU|nr:Hypothetical predicted protein [Olea europaea subsp. europaea]